MTVKEDPFTSWWQLPALEFGEDDRIQVTISVEHFGCRSEALE
jgi:hypothetical protein